MLPVQRGTFLVLNSKQCKLKRKSTRVTSCHLAYDHNAPTCLPTKFAQVKASTVHSIGCTMHMARQVTVVTVVARLFNATGLHLRDVPEIPNTKVFARVIAHDSPYVCGALRLALVRAHGVFTFFQLCANIFLSRTICMHAVMQPSSAMRFSCITVSS